MEVDLNTGKLGGEDFFNLSDDGDLLLSVLGVLGVLGSEGITFTFLLLFTGGGRVEFRGGVFLSLLLEVEGLLVFVELSFRVLSGGSKGFSLGSNFNHQGFEVELSLGFSGSSVFKGGLEGNVDFSELADDVVELFSGEGGSNLHEGEDGVGVTDLVELGEGSKDFLVWLDGAELGDDDFNSIDDSFSLNFELLEFLSILSSLFSEISFLFVEDVKLDDLVLEVGLEFSDLLGEGGDF